MADSGCSKAFAIAEGVALSRKHCGLIQVTLKMVRPILLLGEPLTAKLRKAVLGSKALSVTTIDVPPSLRS